MLAMTCPKRYPIPMPEPIMEAPAAMPTPTTVISPDNWSSASMGCSVVKSSISSLLSALLSLLGLGALVALVGVYRQLYVNLRQDSEDVSLQHGDEDLERVEDYRRGHGDDRHQSSRHGEETASVQDEAQKDEDDQMPR